MNAAVTKPKLDSQESRDVGGIAVIAGIAIGLFWSAGVSAFLLGYHGGGLADMTPQSIAGIAFISLAPALVFAAGGWIARELLHFARTARLLDYSVRRLAAPVANAKADARSVADAITEQVDRLNRESEGALMRLSAMEEVLRHHADAVQTASVDARKQVDVLIEDLRRERTALAELSDHLHTEANKIAETIDRQTEVVSTATRVAANQAEEGRSILDKGASAMMEAAGGAQRAAEKAALAIDEQLRDKQALVAALEDRGGRLEDIARIHSENVKIVQQTTHELNLAADAGRDSMKSASEAAIEQARRVGEIIEKETNRAVERGMEEIERLRRAAQAAREAAESAGLSLEANADAVLHRVHAASDALRQAETAAASVKPLRGGRAEPSLPPDRRAALEDDWREEQRAFRPRSPLERTSSSLERTSSLNRTSSSLERTSERVSMDFGDDGSVTPLRGDMGRRGNRFGPASMSRPYDGGHDELNGRRGPQRPHAVDDLDDYGRHEEDDSGEWRWRDLMKNMDDSSAGMLAGEAVVNGLRRAGVDPARALDPDMTARVVRARRRTGSGEARAIVLDGAPHDVRRTSAALAADPTLRGRAEEFVGEHARLVRRAIDENDAGLLSQLLDSDTGRAYLLLDAALAGA